MFGQETKSPVTMTRFIIVALAAISVARGDTVVETGVIRMTLPTGYMHVRLQGDDSVPGEIHVQQPKLKITYDIGLMASVTPRIQELDKGTLASLVYFEETQLNGIDCFFMCLKHSDGSGRRNLSLYIPRVGGFTVEVGSYQEMVLARSAFTKIKFAR
jgi:hypothetical protein